MGPINVPRTTTSARPKVGRGYQPAQPQSLDEFGFRSVQYGQSILLTQGKNWGFQDYKQWLKLTQVPRPAKTWLMMDEHPDSINDGYFINNPSGTAWQDIPASYHNGACGFSFADGHSEIKKWKSATSKYDQS